MEYIGFIGILLGALIVIRLYLRGQDRKRTLAEIRSQFGKIPNRILNQEGLQYLMANSDSRDIDDITWNDLDMDKVYARINNCNSFVGEQVLYRRLHDVSEDNREIINRENLIKKLDDKIATREEIQMLLEKLGRRKISYFLPQFLQDINSFLIPKIFIYKIMSLLLFGTLILGIFNAYFLYVTGLIFLTNLVIYTLGKHRFEMHLEMLSTIVGVVSTANTLIKKYNIVEGNLETRSMESALRMRKAINRIVHIQRKMETALSGDIGALIFDYLVGSTLWDFHVFHKIVSLLMANKEEFMNLYTYVGEIDAAISISSYRKSISHYCQSDFHEEKVIQFTDMYHPLVAQPICNDVHIDSNYIITGSNASGKSTYIKAVAINMLLAQSINTTLSRTAKIPRVGILTSMAVRDDVTSGESYYIREVNYLKRIVTQLREDQLTLCIVDEILKGTNTEERIAASVAILNYMNQKNCLVIVSSHDVRISELLNDQFMNCHFTEQMKDHEIYFDYKIKSGVSKSKNAIKLLRHMGFPEEIINHAESIVAQV